MERPPLEAELRAEVALRVEVRPLRPEVRLLRPEALDLLLVLLERLLLDSKRRR